MRIGHHFYNWDHEWESDIERCIRLTQETGWEGFEFKAPIELPPGELRALCEKHQVECAALGGVIGAEGMQQTLDYLHEAGVPILRGRTTLEENARWVQYAADRGITIALHPHIGRGGAGTGEVETLEDMVQYLDERPGLMACPDTANLLHLGSDPVDAIRVLGDRVAYTHLKDFDRRIADQGRLGDAFVDLGDGDLDLPAVMNALEGIGYTGWLMVERDGRVDDYIQSARNMRQVLRDLGY